MRVLVFEVRGPYAHFRRVYTTTSAYSYSFPPRTAILGLIGAILGIDGKPRASHLKKIGTINVAVSLQSPIEKIRITVNHPSTKESGKRLQIPIEVLKDPKYLVFASEGFDEFDRLVEMVKNREAVYTPFLGISEFIAVVDYVGVFEARKASCPTVVDSVLPAGKYRMDFEKGVLYLRERATRMMDENRRAREYATYILRSDGKGIKVKDGPDVLEVGEWRITWM